MREPNDTQAADDARAAAANTKETVKDAGRTAADKAKSVGARMKDALEDVIPGDSDGDGH
jgi:hypothetical protein